MRKSTLAPLLSAFVFPGLGHLYLRSYARASILLVITAAALFDFTQRAWQAVAAIRAQLVAEINATGVIDLETLIAHAMAIVDHIDRQPFTIATWIMFASWLVGIVDSHRLGKKLEETPPLP